MVRRKKTQVFAFCVQTARRWIPLTFGGGIFLAASLSLLAYALVKENSYFLLFSLAVLLLIALLLILGFLTTLGLEKSAEWVVAPAVPVAGQPNLFTIKKASLPPFVRLYATVEASAWAGRQSRIEYRAFSRASARAEGRFAFFLPFSGTLRCKTSYFVGDLFGFTAFFLSTSRTSRVIRPIPPPRPASIPAHDEQWVEAYGLERSDPERLYVRDYQPGDRARDINWKLAEKYGSLMIRHAAGFPEEVAEICVAGVPGQLRQAEDGWSLAHLEILKRAMARFIQKKIQEKKRYKIRVIWGNQVFVVRDEDSLAAFMVSFSRLAFADSPLINAVGMEPTACFATNFALLPAAFQSEKNQQLFVTVDEKKASGKIKLFPSGFEGRPRFSLKKAVDFSENSLPAPARPVKVKAVFYAE